MTAVSLFEKIGTRPAGFGSPVIRESPGESYVDQPAHGVIAITGSGAEMTAGISRSDCS